MRTPVLALPLLVAACGHGDDTPPVPEADRIACALSPGAGFARDCAIKRIDGGLVVRHPDGGFRRIVFTGDARRIAGDGAEPARLSGAPGGEIEIAIGGARYRLPAAALAPAR